MDGTPAPREPLSAVDAAWFHMDTPFSPMVINAVMEFDGPLPFSALVRLAEERLLPRRRFRQRIAAPSFDVRPFWEDDAHFSLRSHLHHVALPAPGDRAALAELVSDLMSAPLDATKPLWQAYLIDGVDGGWTVKAIDEEEHAALIRAFQ